MTDPLKFTKPLIDLAGKLDFHIRHGNAKNCEEIVKQMRVKLNKVQTFLKNYEVVD